ncbi:hypothetical protein ACFC09_02395 [Streptomyces sp. NPDC056161]|uniref:hypothetical protein n=1 Tax=Streptomyces sp. NPDC056161 TaxID=3345732 RepID=UPI0035DA2B36
MRGRLGGRGAGAQGHRRIGGGVGVRQGAAEGAAMPDPRVAVGRRPDAISVVNR